MNKIIIHVLFAVCCLLLICSPTIVYASVAHDLDCTKCHNLSTSEVQNILKKSNNPDAKVLKIQMSPLKGVWEVVIESKGKAGLFYIDFSKRYLFSGSIIDISAGIDKTKERLGELRRIEPSRVSLKNALLLGDKNADKKVIVFTDPDCPFCSKYHAELKKVVTQRKDIAFYIKLFPLTKLHPDAYWKSKSIMCSASLALLEDNFEKKPIPKPNCETKEIDKNIKLGEELGITGTPTTVMPDGSVQSGFVEADKLIKIIDSIKKKGTGK